MATPPSSTVLRAFDLLWLFADRPVLGAREAASLLGAPRSTVHRLLVTLKEAGVLESNADGRYRLGLRLFELGALAPARRSIHDVSRPVLLRLSSHFGLTASLASRDGFDLVCLERITNDDRGGWDAVGQRSPLHESAAGKIMLAFAPRAVLEHYLSDGRPGSRAPHTCNSRRLLDELTRVRRTGVAVDRDHHGAASIATRVRDRTGSVIASISLDGAPMPRRGRFRSIDQSLMQVATEIERSLGWLACNEPRAEGA